MPSNKVPSKFLTSHALEKFWDICSLSCGIWLGLWPSLCFIVEPHRIARRYFHTKRGTISYRTALERFSDALWLELWPVLCGIVTSNRIACRYLQTKRGAISYQTMPSRRSGTPCGSRYGWFYVSSQNIVEVCVDGRKRF